MPASSHDRFDLVLVADTVLTPAAIAGGGISERTAIGIRDGLIAAVAPAAEATGWLREAVAVRDLGDATISAGFVDAHIHPIMGLGLTRGADLSGITTAAALRAALAEHIARIGPDQEWVLGWGLDPAVFEGGEFGNHLLDGVDDGRKVVLTLFDSHSALVSKAAVAAAGIRGDERFPDASSLGLDASGRPNGMLYEYAAQRLVLRHVPEQTFEERVTALTALLRGMAGTGLVGGQMLDLMAPDSFALLEAIEERGDLPLRLRISPSVLPGYSDDDLDRHLELQRRAGRRWHVRGVKLMIDGTIDNGTAWLFEPDTRGESTRSLWLDPAEYERAVRFFHDHGIPTATHAIGDKGIAFVARTLHALPAGPVRHRIEHIETLPDEVLDEIVAAGAAASMQPTHCTLYTRADHADNWSERLGPDRADRGWRTRDLHDRGAVLTLGSDWPIAPYDPRGILGAAQLRRTPGRSEMAPVHPEQGISARVALEGYTDAYWRSVGEPGGRIAPGLPAHLTAWARNPLTTDPDEFVSSVVVLTVVDGEVVE